MKKTVVKIKAKSKTDEIWCEINGTTFELMGAYIALTENLIQSFSKETKNEELALNIMLMEVIDCFKKGGIDVKELIKSE